MLYKAAECVVCAGPGSCIVILQIAYDEYFTTFL